MEYITRKSLLYKSGLGFYCINHVQGCHHGCRYPCYAYSMARAHGQVKAYADWCLPKLVANAAELLSKELDRLKTRPDYVRLCLTTDPFMYGYEEVIEMSLRLIGLINSHGIPCSILTKGLLPLELADRDRFHTDNILGISLISINEEFRKSWEPNAAPYPERIAALRALHDHGCRTLVHMEPYPTPNLVRQDLTEILRAVDFVDHIYFSGWNYNPRVKEFSGYKEFYRDQADLVWRFCREHAIQCDM
ncbi:MAG: radical SAM protein [Bacteroidota bacterium]|nr:radical SAM protein [Bacteroidota bacterium]